MGSTGFEIVSAPHGSVVGTYFCETFNFPVSHVEWWRNGVSVSIDNIRYSTEQILTDRERSIYRNLLRVHDIRELVGDPVYRCRVRSSQSSVPADIHSTPTGITHNT